MGNNDISEATGLPKATVTRLTHTLTELGYLNRIGRLGTYELNPSLLALGYCVLSNIRAREIAHDHMQKLADFGDAMVALGSRDRLSMIYVDLCTSGSLRTLHLNVGSRVSMHNSAMGRAFLSGITENEREYFFDRFKKELGREWKPMRARIEESIEQIRKRGFCLVDGEWQRDVRSVAAPLISADGDVVMAINCTTLTFNSTVARFENELGPRLAHLCSVVSPMLRRT
jgi:DNA-binding IclR family transcriptional regulator